MTEFLIEIMNIKKEMGKETTLVSRLIVGLSIGLDVEMLSFALCEGIEAEQGPRLFGE